MFTPLPKYKMAFLTKWYDQIVVIRVVGFLIIWYVGGYVALACTVAGCAFMPLIVTVGLDYIYTFPAEHRHFVS